MTLAGGRRQRCEAEAVVASAGLGNGRERESPKRWSLQ